MGNPSYRFDDIEDFQRQREIEDQGTVVNFPGDRWIRIAAASDGNAMWRTHSEKLLNELNRLRNAKAPAERVRAFLASKYAALCGRGWGGWKAAGVEIPYSPAAFEALLLAADDVYATVDQIVWETKNFRGAKIEAVVEQGKD